MHDTIAFMVCRFTNGPYWSASLRGAGRALRCDITAIDMIYELAKGQEK